METDIYQILMNGGSNVAFAMFLLYQYKEQQKRADSREKRGEEREREIRARYDKVILELQQRESKIREDIVKEITDLDKRMSLLEHKLEEVAKIVQQIKLKVFGM